MPNQPDNKTKELTQTIANASIIIRNTENKGRILQKEDTELFPVLANSIRFGNILLSNYVNKIDNILENNFLQLQ